MQVKKIRTFVGSQKAYCAALRKLLLVKSAGLASCSYYRKQGCVKEMTHSFLGICFFDCVRYVQANDCFAIRLDRHSEDPRKTSAMLHSEFFGGEDVNDLMYGITVELLLSARASDGAETVQHLWHKEATVFKALLPQATVEKALTIVEVVQSIQKEQPDHGGIVHSRRRNRHIAPAKYANDFLLQYSDSRQSCGQTCTNIMETFEMVSPIRFVHSDACIYKRNRVEYRA